MSDVAVVQAKRQRLDGLAQSWFDEQFVLIVAHLCDLHDTSEQLMSAYE